MSHPYWPQPRYLFQRAVPHGPYPDAMGDYGSRYTHGSFSRRRAYALPPYVARERTGLEGDEGHPFEHGSSYYGFGDTIVGDMVITCVPGQFVDKFIGKLKGEVPGYNKYTRLVYDPLFNALGSEMKKALASGFSVMLQKVGQGEQAFRNWFMPNVAFNAQQASGVSQSVFGEVVPLIFGPIKAVLNECKASVAPPPAYDPYKDSPDIGQPDGSACSTHTQCISKRCSGGKCVYNPLQLVEAHLGPYVPAQTELAEKLTWDPMRHAMLVGPQVQCTKGGGTWEVNQVTGQGTCIGGKPSIPSNGKVPVTTKKAGIGTAVVLGAAALAALALLR